MKRHDEATVKAVRAETTKIAEEREQDLRIDPGRDGFGAELEAEEKPHALLAEVASLLHPVTPSDALRARLMASAAQGRLDRYRLQVARLLDIDEERASELLDGIDDPSSFEAGPLPGIDLFHVEGGETVDGAITGFIRIAPGGVFPHHEHLGHEYVLVVQGAFRDEESGEVYRPGDLSTMTPGTAHELRVLPGPTLIYLAVVFEGVGIGGEAFRPGDPRI
jgi:putative transcriptional regulator